MMSARNQLIALVIAYPLVICTTMFISGWVTKKTTLYDRFLINLDSIVLPVADTAKSVDFYTQVLDFTPIRAKSTEISPGVILSNKQKVYFHQEDSPSATTPDHEVPSHAGTIVVKVRNGLKKLHLRLLEKSQSKAVTLDENETLPPKRISALQKKSWGTEFLISDPDGNKIVFYHPKKFTRGRH